MVEYIGAARPNILICPAAIVCVKCKGAADGNCVLYLYSRVVVYMDTVSTRTRDVPCQVRTSTVLRIRRVLHFVQVITCEVTCTYFLREPHLSS